MPVDPLPTAEAMVAELRRAVARGEEGAGTLPAKEAVKVRPADWHRLTAGARRAAALIEQQADEIESLERRVQIAEDHATAAEENVSDLTEDLARLVKERDEALDLAHRSTRRLVEAAEPGFIGAFARRDAALAERDQFRDRLTAAEAELARLREALFKIASLSTDRLARDRARETLSPEMSHEG